VQDAWKSSEFHANHPTSTLWTNVNGYSCEVDASSACGSGGFPLYVLNASTAAQVARVVKWAGERNVRVNVKSTGHDFLGR
jgi:FAD/FMN-containing dehydrogenase